MAPTPDKGVRVLERLHKVYLRSATFLSFL